jgi:hypothetical protein
MNKSGFPEQGEAALSDKRKTKKADAELVNVNETPPQRI